MRTRVWRIAMFSLFIFALGCVGCAKRPTSAPFIPSPTRFANESAVYTAVTTSQLIGVPRRLSPAEFTAVADLKDVYFAFDKAGISPAAARASVNDLVLHGLASTRFAVISYGEERGVCREHHERCWSRNRRAHFAVKPD